MVKCYKKSISLSDLWVSSHDKTSDFHLTSWQRGESPIPMLVFRLILATLSIAILSWSLQSSASAYYLTFLTNWGLLIITALTVSSFLISCLAACKKIPDSNKLPWYVSFYWVFFNVGVTIAIMITALYWILLYNPNDEEENSKKVFLLDLSTHGFNSCIAVAELVLSRTPVRLLHMYQPLSLGIWYAAFSAIYYLAGGTDSLGNPFIYNVLDWRQPLQAGIVVAGSAVSLVVLYLILWGVCYCRDKISISVIRAKSIDLPLTPPDRHTQVV